MISMQLWIAKLANTKPDDQTAGIVSIMKIQDILIAVSMSKQSINDNV